MKLVAHKTVESFLSSAGGPLMAEEEENSLILSIAGRLEGFDESGNI